MFEICPTCHRVMNAKHFAPRSVITITEQGRAVLARMRGDEPMPKCNRCGAPTLLGFGSDDQPLLCAPCEQVLAAEGEREQVRP